MTSRRKQADCGSSGHRIPPVAPRGAIQRPGFSSDLEQRPLGNPRPFRRRVEKSEKLNQPFAKSQHDSMVLRVNAELLHDILQVKQDSLIGYRENLADLPCCFAFGCPQ